LLVPHLYFWKSAKWIRGPGGRSFSWHVEDGGPLLLVAGGAGLVPLRAMLRHRLAHGGDVETCLVLSVRSPEELLYRDELAEWERAGVAATVTLTREQPAGWSGPRRRVDRELLAAAGPPPEARPHVFVCGSTAFVEAAAALARRARPRPSPGADRALRGSRMSLLASAS
jgi:NAD(P)H-flavin reductase